MKRTIVIVTNSYPYSGDTVETFLAEEINELFESEIRKEINLIIAPLSYGGYLVKVPDGVEVLKPILDVKERRIVKILKLFRNTYVFRASVERAFFNKGDGTRFYSDLITIANSAYIYGKVLQFFKYFLSKIQHPVGIYTYWLTPATSALIDLKHSKFGKKILFVVSRAHRYDLYDYVSYHPLRKRDLVRADKIYPVSQSGAEYLLSRYGVHTEVKYLGVKRFGDEVINVSSSSKTIDESKSINILSCSHVVEVKRVDLIAQSVIQLCKMLPNKTIRWTHIGDGKDKGKVFRLISESDVKNLVFDFRGYVPNNEVRRIMHTEKFHCIINLSSSEGLPVSLMEAAEAGIPLIATNVGGTGEIVKDVGILLDKDISPSEVALAVVEIVNNYDIYSQKSKDKFLENFDARKNYISFWNNLIELFDKKKEGIKK